jgi:hypothetical protein
MQQQTYNPSLNPSLLIGKFRRFGVFGPAYEILGLSEKQSEKGIVLNVRVVDTGELLGYPFISAIDDPEA